MKILVIRTDKIVSELSLYEDNSLIEHIEWEAHRNLADTIHKKIKGLLTKNNLDWQSIEGIVCFRGPGSFTGLRIGLSVANALSYSLGCQIVSQAGDCWEKRGIERLLAGENQNIVLPEYGAEAKITKPKK